MSFPSSSAPMSPPHLPTWCSHPHTRVPTESTHNIFTLHDHTQNTPAHTAPYYPHNTQHIHRTHTHTHQCSLCPNICPGCMGIQDPPFQDSQDIDLRCHPCLSPPFLCIISHHWLPLYQAEEPAIRAVGHEHITNNSAQPGGVVAMGTVPGTDGF